MNWCEGPGGVAHYDQALAAARDNLHSRRAGFFVAVIDVDDNDQFEITYWTAARGAPAAAALHTTVNAIAVKHTQDAYDRMAAEHAEDDE